MAHTVIRKAGLLEKYHVMRNYLGHDSCIAVAASYSETISKTTLYPALAKVIQTHAALGIYLQDESTQNVAFVRLPSVDLDAVVTFVDDDDLALIIEQEFLRPFGLMEKNPLWRLSVLKDNTIVFTCHHCICDGKGGVAFHKALTSALNDLSIISQNSSTNVNIPPIQLIAPIEQLLDLSVSTSTVFRELFGLFAPVSWTKGYFAWTGNPVIDSPDLQTNCRVLFFSTEVSTTFLEICRAHKATVTSTLYILAISIIAHLVRNEPDSSSWKTIASSIPISLRELAHTSPDVICSQASGCAIYSPATGTEFSWKAAAALASALRSDSEVQKSKELIGSLKFLYGKYKAFHKNKRGKKRQFGFELSNVGRSPWVTDPNEKWKVGRMVFAQCGDAVAGPAFKLNVIGDPEGGLGVSVTWGEKAIAGSFIQSFISEFRKGYSELIRSQNVVC